MTHLSASGKNIRRQTRGNICNGAPKSGLMTNFCLYVSHQRGNGSPTDITRVVSTRRWVRTNWLSDRTPQRSIEPVVANFSVRSDFIEEDQVSRLGTMHPLLIFNLFYTWSTCLHDIIIRNAWTSEEEEEEE